MQDNFAIKLIFKHSALGKSSWKKKNKKEILFEKHLGKKTF